MIILSKILSLMSMGTDTMPSSACCTILAKEAGNVGAGKWSRTVVEKCCGLTPDTTCDLSKPQTCLPLKDAEPWELYNKPRSSAQVPDNFDPNFKKKCDTRTRAPKSQELGEDAKFLIKSMSSMFSKVKAAVTKHAGKAFSGMKAMAAGAIAEKVAGLVPPAFKSLTHPRAACMPVLCLPCARVV